MIELAATPVDRRLSVAPMMDCTDRYDRAFLRCLTRRTLLYTEMIVAEAILHGERERVLAFDAAEHPVALQLGGSDPAKLAQAARLAEAFGYDEVNLNVGCPSDRVRSGRFGACLMAEPDLVARSVAAMLEAVAIPVTVKCRIGIDDMDDEATLPDFIARIAGEGCRTFSPRANLMPGGAPANSSESTGSPHRIFTTAFCPPMVLADPCRMLSVVTPPARLRHRPMASSRSTSAWRTWAVIERVPSLIPSDALWECASMMPGIT
jgi:hypothetical protein